MSKRAIDPLARARAFPKMPSPRRQTASTERRLNLVERSISVAISAAAQPQASTPIETLDALPQATSEDIGRQIIVQLPGDTLTSIYVGVLLPDGTVIWQLMAFGEIIGGGGTSAGFTFIGHVLPGDDWDGVWEDSTDIYVADSSRTGLFRYNKSSGFSYSYLISVAGSIALTRDASGNTFLAQPGSTRIQKYDSGQTLVVTTPSARGYNSLYHVQGTSDLFATSATNNAAYKLNMTTLAIVTSTTTGLVGPQGIAVDSAGNIYVANSGGNTIRKYSPAWVFQVAWGSAGSGNGQFSTPKQMAFDDADRLYVADSGNNRVQVFDTAGVFLGKFGSVGAGSGELSAPTSVYVQGSSIAVADTGNNRVSRWLRG